MPVTKSALKKLRKDKKRTKQNDSVEALFKRHVKAAQKSPTSQSVSQAFKLIDKASKHSIIHKNKAGRIKSRLSKLVKSAPTVKTTKKKTK